MERAGIIIYPQSSLQRVLSVCWWMFAFECLLSAGCLAARLAAGLP